MYRTFSLLISQVVMPVLRAMQVGLVIQVPKAIQEILVTMDQGAVVVMPVIPAILVIQEILVTMDQVELVVMPVIPAMLVNQEILAMLVMQATLVIMGLVAREAPVVLHMFPVMLL
jgi:hypothetical protein